MRCYLHWASSRPRTRCRSPSEQGLPAAARTARAPRPGGHDPDARRRTLRLTSGKRRARGGRSRMRSRCTARLFRRATIASPRAPLKCGRRTRRWLARRFRTRPRSTPRTADRWREGTPHRPRWRDGFSACRSLRALEFHRARRLEFLLPALQAGQDSPAPGRNALAEFLRVGLAFLAHPLGFLGARFRAFTARGGKLGLVSLHAFRDRAPPRLDVAAEFLDVRRAGTFASLLGAGVRCNARGEERECHRDECFSDRHGASWILLNDAGPASLHRIQRVRVG